MFIICSENTKKKKKTTPNTKAGTRENNLQNEMRPLEYECERENMKFKSEKQNCEKKTHKIWKIACNNKIKLRKFHFSRCKYLQA